MRWFVILVLVQLALGLPVDKVPEHDEPQGLPEEVVENGRTLRENDPDHPLWKRLDEYVEFLENGTPELTDQDVSFAAAAEETTAIHHGRCKDVPGTCIDLNAYMCGPANSIVKNKCPGGNNIRCCLDGFEIKPRPCDKDPRFACVDRTRETCATFLKNMCPGPTSTNCCLDKKIAQPKVDPPKVDPPKKVVPMGLPAGCSVPNVPSIVDPSNRQLTLNTKINRGYAQFAHCYQRIAQPSGSFTSSSCRIPVWYAIAPYASRNVGKGEAAILGALAGLAAIGSSPLAIPSAAKLLYEAVSQGLGGATVCNTPTVTKRLISLMISIGVKNTANTLLNALEHGNRLIFADVGLFGQRYLEWRAIQDSATFSPDTVVTDFSKKMNRRRR